MFACGFLLGSALTVDRGTAFAGVTVKEVVPDAATPKVTPLLVIYGGNATSTPYVPTGWMGNNGAISFDDRCTENPHSGSACIKLEYKAPDGWAGIVWQDVANDWGEQDGGHNITGATKLTFWARGSEGGERVDFLFGVIKRGEKPFPDSDTGKISASLTKDWRQYSIDLSGKNLARIKTGFGWSLAGQGKPVTFYLDDIQYE
jgi:hypothetical protein